MPDHTQRERNKARKRVNDHMSRYLKTGGEDGHIYSGAPTLLLTTIGRESGNANTTPLIYGRDGDRYLLVASRTGAPRHPGWYRNLSKTPKVQIQVMAEHLSVRARTATPEEKPALWRIMTKLWPPFEEYQARTEREIPVVVLELTA
jgi:deazaflavin-dependent oxidoreductase (nitroreductase family)